MVDALFDVLQAMRDRPASPQAQAYAAELAAFPGDTQWTEYYHNQDELCYDFCSMILYAKGFPEDKIKDILSLIFILLRMPELDAGQLETITPSELAEGYKFLADTLNSLLESISGDLHRRFSGEDDPEPIGGYMGLMRCPAVKFAICVFLPCAASFHTTPGILLQNAVNGDEKALERLLIIDKHALTIPGVAAIEVRPASRSEIHDSKEKQSNPGCAAAVKFWMA